MNDGPAGECMDFSEFERETERSPLQEQPRPLIRDLRSAEPYPVDALGDVLGSTPWAMCSVQRRRPFTTGPRYRWRSARRERAGGGDAGGTGACRRDAADRAESADLWLLPDDRGFRRAQVRMR